MGSYVEPDPFVGNSDGIPIPDERRPIIYDRADVAGAALLGKDSESFARSLFDSSPDCIKLIALDGSLKFMNRNGMCAMEVDDFDALRGAPWPSLWPEETRDRIASSLRTAASGRVDRFEAYCPTAKGTPRWWEVSVTPVLDARGKPRLILSVSRDITERVEQIERLRAHEEELERLAAAQAAALAEKEKLLAEKTLLVQEVDHRVKNSLALVNSLLRVQGRTVEEKAAREALQRASGRVQAIATVHERLYRQGSEGKLDLADYLEGLCRDLADSAEGTGIKVETNTTDAGEASGQDAVAVGLIVTELVTNAVRHANPDGGTCTIEVSCRRDAGRRELVIQDDGCGLPDGFDPARSKGLGMRVVLGNLQRFDGTLEAGKRPGGGTRFRIVF